MSRRKTRDKIKYQYGEAVDALNSAYAYVDNFNEGAYNETMDSIAYTIKCLNNVPSEPADDAIAELEKAQDHFTRMKIFAGERSGTINKWVPILVATIEEVIEMVKKFRQAI